MTTAAAAATMHGAGTLVPGESIRTAAPVAGGSIQQTKPAGSVVEHSNPVWCFRQRSD